MIALIIVAALIVILALYAVSVYNRLVRLKTWFRKPGAVSM